MTADELRQWAQDNGLVWHKPNEGDAQPLLRVKVADLENVRPDSRGEIFEGVYGGMRPERTIDDAVWMLDIFADKDEESGGWKKLYGFHDWLIDSIEIVEANDGA